MGWGKAWVLLSPFSGFDKADNIYEPWLFFPKIQVGRELGVGKANRSFWLGVSGQSFLFNGMLLQLDVDLGHLERDQRRRASPESSLERRDWGGAALKATELLCTIDSVHRKHRRNAWCVHK